MPYYPLPDSEGHKYTTTTYWERLVSEYTGLPLPAVYELGLIEYLTYRRDAFIWKLSRTEKGTEYLDNAWRCEQTEPDRAALRKFRRREEAQDGE